MQMLLLALKIDTAPRHLGDTPLQVHMFFQRSALAPHSLPHSLQENAWVPAWHVLPHLLHEASHLLLIPALYLQYAYNLALHTTEQQSLLHAHKILSLAYLTDLPLANIRCVLLPLPHCGTVHIPLMYKKDDHDLCCRQRPLSDNPASLILVLFQKVCLALLPAQGQKTYRTSAEYQSLLFQYILMEFQGDKRTQALRVCSLPASDPV